MSKDLVHAVLAGLNESHSKGGLIIRKKPKEGDEEGGGGGFKLPSGPSLLGLDKLAAVKEREKKEREVEQARKRQLEEEDLARKEKFIRKDEKRERQIREQRVETPSHTGGVSEEARKRDVERRRRDDRGLRVEHKRERDKGYYEREWKREGRNERRDRYERDRRDHRDDKRDRRGRDSERRERDCEQETPGRHAKEELLTPLVPVKDTPGHAGWEEEDTPGKLSRWDLPTPGSGRREDDHSMRSSDWRPRDKSSTRRDKHERKYEKSKSDMIIYMMKETNKEVIADIVIQVLGSDKPFNAALLVFPCEIDCYEVLSHLRSRQASTSMINDFMLVPLLFKDETKYSGDVVENVKYDLLFGEMTVLKTPLQVCYDDLAQLAKVVDCICPSKKRVSLICDQGVHCIKLHNAELNRQVIYFGSDAAIAKFKKKLAADKTPVTDAIGAQQADPESSDESVHSEEPKETESFPSTSNTPAKLTPVKLDDSGFIENPTPPSSGCSKSLDF